MIIQLVTVDDSMKDEGEGRRVKVLGKKDEEKNLEEKRVEVRDYTCMYLSFTHAHSHTRSAILQLRIHAMSNGEWSLFLSPDLGFPLLLTNATAARDFYFLFLHF